MRFRTLLWVVSTVGATCVAQHQPANDAAKICPIRVGLFPTRWSGDFPILERARFEVRACESGYPIQLLGFRKSERRPSLFIDTQQGAIGLLISVGEILVLQVEAGSSSPTFIARFRKGNPILVSREDGVGGVSYSEEHPETSDYVVISVPQKTFPGPNGEFPNVPPHRFRLKMFDE